MIDIKSTNGQSGVWPVDLRWLTLLSGTWGWGYLLHIKGLYRLPPHISVKVLADAGVVNRLHHSLAFHLFHRLLTP